MQADTLFSTIERLFNKGDYSYIKYNYVCRDNWYKKLLNDVIAINIDNITDFNYSNCFSHFITSIEHPFFSLGSKEFSDYIRSKSSVHGIMLHISMLAPYAALIYVKYFENNGEIKLSEGDKSSGHPIGEIGEEIAKFLTKYNITILNDGILNTIVPNVSLELKEENVTIYNCLF